MTRFPRNLRRVVLMILIVAASTRARAQTASQHFPNDDGGANVQVGGTMNLTLKVEGFNRPIMASVPVTVGETGQQVAVAAAAALCVNASAGGPPTMTCGPCTFPIGTTTTVTCTTPQTGFSITRINTQTSFSVAPTGDKRIQALNCRTPSGNTHGPDLLERVLVRLAPNGVNGNVVFRVHHFQGGQNPRNFTVNTTGLSDQALHDAIAAGYNGMGLGLTAVTSPPADCFFSFDPALYPGKLVEVTYSPVTQTLLQDFEVDGLRSGTTLGQIVVTETAGVCAPPLPSAADCPIDTLTILADKQTLTWSNPPSGCSLPLLFDVVRADLGCRCGSCASPLPGECAGSNLTAQDTGPPPAPGQGFWYLVRVHGGTWNSTGTDQCVNQDPALALECP